MHTVLALALAAVMACTLSSHAESDGVSKATYSQSVLSDGPVLYYRLGDTGGPVVRNHAPGPDAAKLDGKVQSVKLGEARVRRTAATPVTSTSARTTSPAGSTATAASSSPTPATAACSTSTRAIRSRSRRG